MKVISAEEIVQWRKEFRALPDLSQYIDDMQKCFVPSTRHSRGNHRRRHNFSFSVTIDDTLGLHLHEDQSNNSETMLKAVIMELNRLSSDNINSVIDALSNVYVSDIESLRKIATILLHKTYAERNFRHHYIGVVNRIDWTVDDGTYLYNLKTLFILELQKSFENISKLSKDEACQVMSTLGVVCEETNWLEQKIYDHCIDFLISQGGTTNIEYVISFLRCCPTYEKREDTINTIMTTNGLPMRIKMILESL